MASAAGGGRGFRDVRPPPHLASAAVRCLSVRLGTPTPGIPARSQPRRSVMAEPVHVPHVDRAKHRPTRALSLRGIRGHPSHPPLTDAAIGMYTLAAALAVIGALGWIEDAAGKAMWLALLGGLVAGACAALTGLLD